MATREENLKIYRESLKKTATGIGGDFNSKLQAYRENLKKTTAGIGGDFNSRLQAYRAKNNISEPEPSKKSTNPETDELESILTQAGYKPPKEKGTGLLEKIFSVLSAAETAPAVYSALSGGDPLKAQLAATGKGLTGKGVYDKKNYEDVLGLLGWDPKTKLGKFGRAATGVAGDILLDPTTYFGGAIMKGGKKVASKVGKTATKIPVVGSKIKGAYELAENLVVPGAKIKRLGPEGEKFWDLYIKSTKASRSSQSEFVNAATKLKKKAVEEGVSPATLTKWIEQGKKFTGDVPKGADAANQITDWFKEFATGEKKRGLLDNELPDYVSRLLTDEAKVAKQTTASLANSMPKPLRVRLASSKGRKTAGIIDDVNKWSMKTNGYKLFQDDIFDIVAQRGVSHLQAIGVHDYLGEIGEKFGKKTAEVGEILVESTAPTLKGKLFPKAMADHIDETYKALTNEESINQVLGMYDKVQNVWKRSVTGFFPAFHGRNMMGGMFNNWVAGVKNPARYTQAHDLLKSVNAGENLDKTIKLGKKTYTYGELSAIMKKNGVVGQPGHMDVMKTIEDVLKPKKGLIGKASRAPGEVMEFTEDRLRGALFLDRVAKGDEAWDAAKKVIQFHFDYAPEGLSDAERLVAKRVIPFYTWTRNNIPLQLSQMMEQPGKYAGVAKTLRSLRGRDPEQRAETQALPDYMKRGFPVRLGEKDGKSQYLYGMGLPMEDLNQITPTGMASRMSPLLKAPIERLTDRNIYFDKPLSDVTNAPAMLGKAPKAVQKWFDYSESEGSSGKITRRLDPYKWHFVTNLAGRGIFTADKMFDPNTMGIIKVLYGTLGVKGRAVDIESEEYWRDRERQDQLEKYSERKGLMKKFTRYYEPKK